MLSYLAFQLDLFKPLLLEYEFQAFFHSTQVNKHSTRLLICPFHRSCSLTLNTVRD